MAADPPDPTIQDMSGPLLVAMALAAAAGFLDAHLYLFVDAVFVANQSGNVVLLGMGLGQRNQEQVVAPAISITMFMVGIAVSTWVHNRRVLQRRRRRPDAVLALEAVLIVLLGAFIWITGGYEGSLLDAAAYPALAVGAFAMGLQTMVLKKVGDVAVATTYESGAVAQLGSETVLASTSADPFERARRHTTIKVLASVVAAYTGGAALAAAMSGRSWVLILPVLVLGALALHLRVHIVRTHPADAEVAPPVG
ncbi:MAG: DUF1275 domain-containing protein [Acidimicrobiales bacterium]|nr:DUF1275 domain-containing protein [Acidimicrobiales bacterium]MCB1261155.1 DUF1275 domain-containing protein [Acidimicrobiales bacterium]